MSHPLGRQQHFVTRLILLRFHEIQIHNDLEDFSLKLMSQLVASSALKAPSATASATVGNAPAAVSVGEALARNEQAGST